MYVIISIQPTNELIEAQTTHSVPWHTHTHTHMPQGSPQGRVKLT